MKDGISKGSKKAWRIVFISATCNIPPLVENLQRYFMQTVGKENEGNFSLTFYGAIDPHEIVESCDLIVLDKIITFGARNSAIYTQLREMKRLSSYNEARFPKMHLLPRNSKKRSELFYHPMELVAKILETLDFSKDSPVVAEPIVFADKHFAEEKVILPGSLPKINVLISLPPHFEWGEKEELQKIVAKYLHPDSAIAIAKNPNSEAIKNAGIVFLGCEEGSLGPQQPKKGGKRRKVGAYEWQGQELQDKLVLAESRSLSRVVYVKKINPKIQVIVVDQTLSSGILKLCESISSFLETPFESEAVATVLRRAVISAQENATDSKSREKR